MKRHILLLTTLLCLTLSANGQEAESQQTGHIAMSIIPKGADLEEAKELLEAIGKSMKSAEGCLAVYTSQGSIGGPMEDPDYLIIQTVHWRSDADLFNWARSDANKAGSDWAPQIMKMKMQMFGFNVDNSLN